MKAIRIHQPGGREVLRIDEIPIPAPGAGEVLVALRAAAVNYLDIWVRTGNVPVTLPRTLGSEGAGVVAKLGEGVTGLEVGQKVVVTPWIYPPHLSSAPNLVAELVGVSQDGCYAEYVSVPATAVWPMPDGLDFPEAAAISLTFTTAYHMLVTRAHLQPGENVLVIGATGGVGTAAIQIAKAMSAFVIAASRNQAKRDRLLSIGADAVVDAAHDFSQEVKWLTAGQGVDLVVEQAGRPTWSASVASVRKGGRIAFCGATAGVEVTVNLQDLYRREITALGCYGGTPEEIGRVFKLVSMGKLQPILDKVFTLSEAKAAQERMEKSLHFGKIVLTI